MHRNLDVHEGCCDTMSVPERIDTLALLQGGSRTFAKASVQPCGVPDPED